MDANRIKNLSHLQGEELTDAIRSFVEASDLVVPGRWRSTDGRIFRIFSLIDDVLVDLIGQAKPKEVAAIMKRMRFEHRMQVNLAENES